MTHGIFPGRDPHVFFEIAIEGTQISKSAPTTCQRNRLTGLQHLRGFFDSHPIQIILKGSPRYGTEHGAEAAF